MTIQKKMSRKFKEEIHKLLSLHCTVNADGQKVTGIGFGRSYDGEHKRKTKYTETDRYVKSASDDSKHGNRSKLVIKYNQILLLYFSNSDQIHCPCVDIILILHKN
ncbi:unnamed protein product [Mytilus coruscus]|uniref:Uncharacterized protein n=1 Tax=Mytilus coruscus TaxID=42192 RepID=A0A6J8AQ83_MYTCO|nr:unnamed protein product [Mytilus coruscus]